MKDASAIARARTSEVDETVRARWQGLDGVALVAVGGYGRAELFPFSDIDLLFLSHRDDLKAPLGAFLQELWDQGLRVSHSVHSPEECAGVSEQNVEFSVSLLDRRFLTGAVDLFEKLRDPPRERLAPALAKLTRERHAKYGHTIFHLEPHVKEAPGAMRDLQVLRWLAKLDGGDAKTPPYELLFRIRTALHVAARRDQNVLHYDMQDKCAALLQFRDAAELMRAYYREASAIYRATLRKLSDAESKRSGLFAAFRDRASRLSNADFSVLGGQVYFRVPPSDPTVLVRLFEFVSRHGLPLARDTEDRASAFETVSITWGELRQILDLPAAPRAVRAMHVTGYLRRLFPELEGIESLVVRDFYHRYTVDEHTLLAIEVAGNLRQEKSPFGELSQETSPYALLFMALLFHDSGKGFPGGRHAEISVEIASRALHQIGATAQDMEAVLFLIRSHMEMSRLMLTRDLTDPGTAQALATIVGTVERLRLLTVLTYCDISAVNPEALTPWRATLLWQLYAATARHLTRALRNEIAEEGLPTRYLLTHTAEEIEEHHRMERTGTVTKLERVESAYKLTVIAPDKPYQFARVAGALASFGMNILRAEAFGNERHVAIETFTFADPMRALELNPTEINRLEEMVRDAVEGRRQVEHLLRARANPKRHPTEEITRVAFDNTASERATLFEITASDRPGLLFDLARSISAKGFNIEVVLIDTEGRKAIDVFYVTDGGRPLDQESAASLRDDLARAAA